MNPILDKGGISEKKSGISWCDIVSKKIGGGANKFPRFLSIYVQYLRHFLH